VNGAPERRPHALIAALPALFMLGLACAVYLGTAEHRIWRGITPGPRFFPVILAGTGALLAVLLLVGQWRGTDLGSLELPGGHGARQVAATRIPPESLVSGAHRVPDDRCDGRDRLGKRCCAVLGVANAASQSGFRIRRAHLACRASTTASCCRPCWRA
jgi:hypothetical protein